MDHGTSHPSGGSASEASRNQKDMNGESFENELRAIDPNFRIKQNANAPEVSGVLWDGIYLFAVPSGEIYDDKRPNYADAMGNPHRTRPEALALAKEYRRRLLEEPGFLDLMREPL